MDIFNHFSCHTKLPIKLDDIREHVLEGGRIESVQFVAADLAGSVVPGFIRVFRWRSGAGPAGIHAQIFYSNSISPEWRRVVICKEMLHLLDLDEHMAKSNEQVSRLISDICAPWLMAASLPGKQDNGGILRALAILLPRDALDTLRDHYKAGRLTRETIAKMARLPEEWMEYLLSDSWAQVLENIHKAVDPKGNPAT